MKNLLHLPPEDGFTLDVLSSAAGLALRALISQSRFEAIATALKGLAYAVGITDAEALRGFWNTVLDAVASSHSMTAPTRWFGPFANSTPPAALKSSASYTIPDDSSI
jgi:hypothetical protein